MTTLSAGSRQLSSQPHAFTGTKHLLRFMVRRDRMRAVAWVGGIVGVSAASVASVAALYDTPEEIQAYASLATADVSIKALAGPGYGLEVPNPAQGAVVMNEIQLYSYLAIALMCAFLIVRHTRAEEETDRAELVRSTSVGRLATLTAAMVWVAILTLLVSALLGSVLLFAGLGVAGTVAYSLGAFGTGLFFIGVSSITAQISSSARAATSSAGAILGISFIIRALGDIGSGALSWASPVGLALNVKAFDGERWWAGGLLSFCAVLLLALGTVLAGRRDMGAGFFHQTPGPAVGSGLLSSPLALAARLQRTSLIGWTVGMAIMGYFMGTVANQADELLENEAVAEFIAQAGAANPSDSFLATMILMVAIIISGFTVSSALRLRAEENNGRTEVVLALPVKRRTLLLGSFVVTALGTAVIVVTSGVATGLGYGIAVSDLSYVLKLTGSALNVLPPLLVVASLSLLLVAARPKVAGIAWLSVAVAAVVGLLAETLKLPQWVRDISPFEHVAAVPAQDFAIGPVLILLAISVALVGLSVLAFDRREVA